MADTVTSKYLFNGKRRKIIRLTNISDGTGEAAVAKVTLSGLTMIGGIVPLYSSVYLIDYNIQGMTSVRLHWDHTTPDIIAVLPAGFGVIDWNAAGGNVDPRTAGGTGNITLTTNGQVSGGTYDITIHFRPKA